MRIARPFFLFLIVSALIPLPAAASSKEELAKTREQIKEAEQKQEQLKQQRAALESELAELQRQLVVAAQQLQQRETALSAAEEKLARTLAQQQTKELELKAERDKLAAMIEAALRVSRTPPEAMVLMPQGAENTIRAARILKMTTAGIKTQAQQIRLQLEELKLLEDKLAAQREAMLKDKQQLASQHESIQKQLAERSDLQQKLGEDERRQAQSIAQLAKQAQNLQDLLGRIEQQRREQKEAEELVAPHDAPVQATRGKLRSFERARGKIRMPASGRLVQRFAESTGRNETSRGIAIKTRPEASVTAPFDGEVVYAGTFMGYGRMVILRHSDDFHTLLSGLADIDTRTGEFLLEGEPIGAMGNKEASTRLYLEIRKDNQPVDPAVWLNNQ